MMLARPAMIPALAAGLARIRIRTAESRRIGLARLFRLLPRSLEAHLKRLADCLSFRLDPVPKSEIFLDHRGIEGDEFLSAAKSRRSVLAGAAAFIAATPAVASSSSEDPIYPIWRRWRDLEEEGAKLAVASSETWDAMPDWARHPRVLLLEAKDNEGKPTGGKLYASYPEEIRQFVIIPFPSKDRRPTGCR